MNPRIRTYTEGDRDKLREIAISTSSGYPRSKPQLVADLLLNYYLNYEPDHFLVAESEDEIVGYLAGSFDTRSCRWIKGILVIPQVLWNAIWRGGIGFNEVRYLAYYLYSGIRGGFRASPPDGYSAHFHINVVKGWRGKGIGTELVNEFITMLSNAEKNGVHVRVRENGNQAGQFFESFGFSPTTAYPTVIVEAGDVRFSRSVMYTKRL